MEGEACNIAQPHHMIKRTVLSECQCSDNQFNRHTFCSHQTQRESEHIWALNKRTSAHATHLHICSPLRNSRDSQTKQKQNVPLTRSRCENDSRFSCKDTCSVFTLSFVAISVHGGTDSTWKWHLVASLLGPPMLKQILRLVDVCLFLFFWVGWLVGGFHINGHFGTVVYGTAERSEKVDFILYLWVSTETTSYR